MSRPIPRLETQDDVRDRVSWFEFMVAVAILASVLFGGNVLADRAFNWPQACTVDGTRKTDISYFKIPTHEGKYRKVFPGENEYELILKSQKFTYSRVSCSKLQGKCK